METQSSQVPANEGTRSIAHDHFFFPPNSLEFFKDLETVVCNAPQQIRDVAEAFRRNLEAVLSTASMPFRLAWAAVQQRRWQKILIAERIRALEFEDKGQTKEYADSQALQEAKGKFDQELSSRDGIQSRAKEVLSDLEHLLREDDMRLSAAELLRQSTVLTWGALEVFANDLFMRLFNIKPRLTGDLMRDERTKKRFQLRDPVKILEQYEYDLSHHMGDILAEHCKIDDVDTLRAVFDVVIPEDDRLREILRQDALWKLYQRRNLILHRRSVVDKAYAEKTGEAGALGTELIVTPHALEEDLKLIRDIGTRILNGVATRFLRTQQLGSESGPKIPE